MKRNYDRMSPTLGELLIRLEEYSEITYGFPAYELSVAEAKLLVESIEKPDYNIEDAIYETWRQG